MPLAKTITIYRFDSPCGKFCYIGQSRDLPQRIGQHRTDSTSSIFEHCSTCKTCKSVQQRYDPSEWRKCFRVLHRVTGKKRGDQRESRCIEAVCRDYIRNPQRAPFPLNKTAELGDSALLLATKRIFEGREVEQERDDIRRERDNTRRALGEVEQERDRVRQDRDSLRWELKQVRRDRDSFRRTLDQVRQERDNTKQALEQARRDRDRFRQEWNDTNRALVQVSRERDRFRQTLGEVEQERDEISSALGETRHDRDSLRWALGQVRHDRDRLRSRNKTLEERWNRTKEPVRKTIFRMARYAALLLAIVVLSGSETRDSLARLGSGLPWMATSTPRPTATRTPTGTPRPTATHTPTDTPQPTPTPTRTPRPSPTPQLYEVVSAGGANARSCPRTGCEILQKLARGSRVTMVGEVAGERAGETARWYRVVLPDTAREGFVYSPLLARYAPSPLEPPATARPTQPPAARG